MTRRTKIVLGVGAAAAAAGVAWWLWQRHGAAPAPDSSAGLCVEGEDGTIACGGDPEPTRSALDALLDIFNLGDVFRRPPAFEDTDNGLDALHVGDGAGLQ